MLFQKRFFKRSKEFLKISNSSDEKFHKISKAKKSRSKSDRPVQPLGLRQISISNVNSNSSENLKGVYKKEPTDQETLPTHKNQCCVASEWTEISKITSSFPSRSTSRRKGQKNPLVKGDSVYADPPGTRGNRYDGVQRPAAIKLLSIKERRLDRLNLKIFKALTSIQELDEEEDVEK